MNINKQLQEELQSLKSSGLFKNERIITTPQGPDISTIKINNVLNFCANNYLGLSSNPEIIEAGIEILKNRGFGMSSVRFICGTQDIHKELERKTADFLGKDRKLAIDSGHLLAIRSAGAYGFVMSSNYNGRPRAAEVMVDGDCSYLVREREKLEDMFAGEKPLPGS